MDVDAVDPVTETARVCPARPGDGRGTPQSPPEHLAAGAPPCHRDSRFARDQAGFVGATGYHDVNRGSEERRTGSDRGAHDELHLQHHTTLHPHGTERGLRRPCLGRHSEPLLGPEAADWGWTFMWPGMPFWLQIGSRNADAPQSDSDRIQIVVPRPKISLDSDLREYRIGGSRCPEEGIQKPGPRREPVGRPKRPGFSATREGPLVGPAESHGDAGANAWHRSGGGAAGKKFESISAHR